MTITIEVAAKGSDLLYGQDIWIEPHVEDYLNETYQASTLAHIKEVIDHTYKVGRPDLEVPRASVLNPDMGDLVCLNIYTYARGVITSPPGSRTGTTYQGYLEELTSMTP